MKGSFLGWTLLAVLSLGMSGCGGDDDDDGGGGACAHAQMVCEGNADIEIDCDDFDGTPSSIKDCVGKAANCDAVAACLFGGS